MNIFYLDTDPKVAAEYHLDKHVVKMIVEYAQLLSTAHRLLDGKQYFDKSKNGRKIHRWKLNDYREDKLYHAVSWNHPCAVWVRESDVHYNWLWQLYRNLCAEYRYRYGGSTDKQHKTSLLLSDLSFLPYNIPRNGWKEPPQAMPEDVKVPNDSIQAYKNYYLRYKRPFARWKVREVPHWYK